MTREPATQIARYDDYIHLVLSGCRLSATSSTSSASTR